MSTIDQQYLLTSYFPFGTLKDSNFRQMRYALFNGPCPALMSILRQKGGSMTQRHNGTILDYDLSRRRGIVELLEQNQKVPFYSTSFYSGQVTREPRIGEAVWVAMSQDPRGSSDEIVLGVWVRNPD